MPVSATKAFQALKDGNKRYWQGTSEAGQAERDHSRFVDLSAGQKPFAAILGCSDSRVPVEAIFDQGPGQLYVVRVAGNVIGPVGLGTLEFAVEELGVRLLLVMGHTGCGAIAASLAANSSSETRVATRNIGELTKRISTTLGEWDQGGQTHDESPSRVAEAFHTRAIVKKLVTQSGFLATAARSGKLLIVGSLYDLETGQVEFFDDPGK